MAFAYDSTAVQANPIGSVISLPTTVAPIGYLLCDGSGVSTSVYANLFNAIGYAHGQPASGQFCIPDYRGRFLRMQDWGTNRDTDGRFAQTGGGNSASNSVGSYQAHAMTEHWHLLSDPSYPQTARATRGATFGVPGDGSDSASASGSGGRNLSRATAMVAGQYGVTPNWSYEVRPINATTNYFIRYK